MSETLQNESPQSERQGSRPQDSGLLAFGRFELDRESGELLRGGERVKLQPQPFRVLQMLAEQAGRVVTREELREEIWGDAYVDWEAGLNLCILQIRRALGDKARDPNFVETLPRRGYRFLPRVETHRRGEQSVSSSAPEVASSDDPMDGPIVELSEDELAAAVAASSARSGETGAPRPTGRSEKTSFGKEVTPAQDEVCFHALEAVLPPPPSRRAPSSRAAWVPTVLLILGFAFLAGQVTVPERSSNGEGAVRTVEVAEGGTAAVPALFPEAADQALTAAAASSPSGSLPMSTLYRRAASMTPAEKLKMEDGVCAVLEASLAQDAECEVRLAASGTAEQGAQDPSKYTLIGTVEREGETLSITAQLTPVEDSASEEERVVPRAQPTPDPVQKTRVAATGDGGAEECQALGQCLDSLPEIPARSAVPAAKYAQPTSATSEALPGLNMPSP